jgi:methyl-accepting chemotaxis protein
MSIRSKLFLAFSIVLALAIGVAAYGILAISDAGDLVVRLYDRPFMAVSHARSAQAKFSDARAAMEHRLLLQGEERKSGDAAFKATMNDVMADLTVVGERLNQADHVQRAATAQQLALDWYRTCLQIVEPPAEGLTMLPMSTNVTLQADAVTRAIDRVVEDASEYGFKFRSQAKAKVAASRANLTILAITTGVIGILLSLGLAYSFGRGIRKAVAISERVADGNLSESISTRRRDELGRLLVSLGKMQAALRVQADADRSAIELKDRDHASQIARRERIDQEIADFRSSVGNILAQADEMAAQMNSTAQALSMISTDADNRSREAVGNATKASANVATVAASTEHLDASIREIIGRLTPATDSISDATEMAKATNKTIGRLAESTGRIGAIVGLIQAIAEQTNLLALNATIEAARAGGAGRGFAVVAAEVKVLAAQTAKAIEEISMQIVDVQSSTSQAVDGIKSITSMMMKTNAVTTEIADAVRQQEAATAEITRSIYSAASATQNVTRSIAGTMTAVGDTNRAATEVLNAAEYMTSHTGDLRASVDRFLRQVKAA